MMELPINEKADPVDDSLVVLVIGGGGAMVVMVTATGGGCCTACMISCCVVFASKGCWFVVASCRSGWHDDVIAACIALARDSRNGLSLCIAAAAISSPGASDTGACL
jgi:hypothetical protein